MRYSWWLSNKKNFQRLLWKPANYGRIILNQHPFWLTQFNDLQTHCAVKNVKKKSVSFSANKIHIAMQFLHPNHNFVSILFFCKTQQFLHIRLLRICLLEKNENLSMFSKLLVWLVFFCLEYHWRLLSHVTFGSKYRTTGTHDIIKHEHKCLFLSYKGITFTFKF